ncbi:MAG: response regulator [Lachnospiraceae bacterium]|jgi:putative two-component system response regulator|nr:response regulator [Lachnospiraceae bacterium]
MSRKVMVVDDVSLNVRMLEDILKNDYIVLTAQSGEEALGYLKKITPDLILLDNTMKGMSGFDVLRVMRKDSVLKSIPVILLSSNEDDSVEIDSLEEGAVDFIRRPYRAKCVQQRVKTHIELADYRKNLEQVISQRSKQIDRMENAFMQCLGELVEFRSGESGNHIVRTTLYCEALAMELRDGYPYENEVTEWFMEDLKKAAPLHDIGKIGVRDQLLICEDELTIEEKGELEEHTLIGEEILSRLIENAIIKGYLRMAKDLAASHHENYDGTGYPKHLIGMEIPLIGRIMSIADTYDTLRAFSHRREPMGHEEACQVIFSGTGTKFDPILVQAFRAVNIQFDDIFQDYGEES